MTPSYSPQNVIVVDPNRQDYRQFAAAVRDRGASVLLFERGERALRAAAAQPASRWLVAEMLPDMSGLELFDLLGGERRAPGFLVAEQYDPLLEAEVLARGNLHFLCKPLDAVWLSSLLPCGGTIFPGPRRRPEADVPALV